LDEAFVGLDVDLDGPGSTDPQIAWSSPSNVANHFNALDCTPIAYPRRVSTKSARGGKNCHCRMGSTNGVYARCRAVPVVRPL